MSSNKDHTGSKEEDDDAIMMRLLAPFVCIVSVAKLVAENSSASCSRAGERLLPQSVPFSVPPCL